MTTCTTKATSVKQAVEIFKSVGGFSVKSNYDHGRLVCWYWYMYDFLQKKETKTMNVMHYLYQQSLNNKNKADLIYTHEVCFWFAILLFSFPFQQIKIPHFYGIFLIGGAKEDRTPDPLLAKQVLSQLSYNPMYINSMSLPKMVGLNGLEPATSPLSGVRSSHLSYRPNFIECFNIISTTAPSVNTFL